MNKIFDKKRNTLNFKIIFFIIIISAFFSCKIEAKNIPFYVESAVFKENSKEARWEFYYSFPDTAVTYRKVDSFYVGELYISVKIKSLIKTEAEREWIVTNRIDNPRKIYGSFLLGQKDFNIPYGQYIADLKIIDVNDTNSSEIASINIIVPNFNDEKLSMSDLELAGYVKDKTSDSDKIKEMFVKGNNIVVPNPNDEFYYPDPFLYAYYEVYKPKSVNKTNIKAIHSLSDGLKHLVKADTLLMVDSVEKMQILTSFLMDSIQSGVYYFQTSISSSSPECIDDSMTTNKKFYYINPSIGFKKKVLVLENQNFENSEFALLDEKATALELRRALIIATKDEEIESENLTDYKAVQRFLFKFWEGRDPDPSTRINERREEFLRCVEFANIQFPFGLNDEGWNTDRGRVLLKYGFPTRRDMNMENQGNRAYEVWFYSEKFGGAYFYFVDKQGFNNYTLVNSSVPGEIKDDNWYNNNVPEHNPGQWNSTPNTNTSGH